MSIFSLKSVFYDYGDNNLLKGIDLSIEKHHKLGLIGRNGCGKTTLFKLIAGQIDALNGDIFKISNINIAYLSQELKVSSNLSLIDYVLSTQKQYLQLKKALSKAEIDVSENHSPKNLERLHQLQNQFDAINGFDIENRIKIVLTALAFPRESWNNPVSLFSGGEQTRIQLAAVLLQPFDLLLLDEPTNHLDIKMIMWLERYLNNLSKPYIIISHDRHFLQQTVTGIIEIRNTKLYRYNVDYQTYLIQREEQTKLQYKEFEQQQEFIKKTEEFIQKNMAGQKVQQAKSRLKMLNKLNRIQRPETERELRIKIDTNQRTGNDIFQIENLAIGYNKPLATRINLNVFYKDKIALIGPNGCGKSTLLRILNQEFSPLEGNIKRGVKINYGYYDQLHINLNEADTVIDTIWSLAPTEPIGYVLSYLARFGFRGDDVNKKVSIISGGERSRLYLAKLIHQKPNLLILDEPTNHLDISMINSLETALKNYDGTILFVSHDRYFIDNIATRKWAFKKGTVIDTNKTLEEIFADEDKPVRRSNGSTKDSIKKKKKINPILLEKKLAEIDLKHNLQKEIEYKISSVHDQLADSSTYGNADRIRKCNGNLKEFELKIKQIQDNIDKLEMEYLEMLEDE